jgi:hypothetical protein
MGNNSTKSVGPNPNINLTKFSAKDLSSGANGKNTNGTTTVQGHSGSGKATGQTQSNAQVLSNNNKTVSGTAGSGPSATQSNGGSFFQTTNNNNLKNATSHAASATTMGQGGNITGSPSHTNQSLNANVGPVPQQQQANALPASRGQNSTIPVKTNVTSSPGSQKPFNLHDFIFKPDAWGIKNGICDDPRTSELIMGSGGSAGTIAYAGLGKGLASDVMALGWPGFVVGSFAGSVFGLGGFCQEYNRVNNRGGRLY